MTDPHKTVAQQIIDDAKARRAAQVAGLPSIGSRSLVGDMEAIFGSDRVVVIDEHTDFSSLPRLNGGQ